MKLTLSLPSRVRADLDRLWRYGIFGHSVEDVAERLISEGVRRLVSEGWLAKDPQFRLDALGRTHASRRKKRKR